MVEKRNGDDERERIFKIMREKMFSLQAQTPPLVPTSMFGTVVGEMRSAMGLPTDKVQGTMDGIVDVSMSGFASPLPRASDYSITAIQSGASTSSTISVDEVCSACTVDAQGSLEMASDAMNNGISNVQLNYFIVGDGNGCSDILTATTENMTKGMAVSAMMKGVLSSITSSRMATSALFQMVLSKTWNENLQWLPDISPLIPRDLKTRDDDGMAGGSSAWMQPCCHELVEYFDFVQNTMGGAVNEVWTKGNIMFEDVVDCCGGCQESGAVATSPSGGGGFPVPPLSVPLMSISKQMEDFQQKVSVIKEMVRQKARMVLYRLRSLEAPDMYVLPPATFVELMDVLVEAEFVYQNLHTVVDQIIEQSLKQMVKKFQGAASAIIASALAVFYGRVCAEHPEWSTLLHICWGVPNSADCCNCCALNNALPDVYSTVASSLELPFLAVNNVATRFDAVTTTAYAPTSP